VNLSTASKFISSFPNMKLELYSSEIVTTEDNVDGNT
jgi:hypothetical protein